MKTSHRSRLSLLAALLAAITLSASASAAISGINTPGTSMASINFDDTNSLSPPPGTTNITPAVGPWNGATLSLPFTTDGITGDTAQGAISASFAGVTYAVAFSNVLLNQSLLNNGFALLVFQFNVEFQLDAGGLPAQPTLYPNFAVNGTVQNPGFAFVSGFINYNGLNADGTANLVETVNYNANFGAPGPFVSTIFGVPNNGTTPALPANSTLTLDGIITFVVDPANINATSFPAPEPGSALLALAAGIPLLLRRRRA